MNKTEVALLNAEAILEDLTAQNAKLYDYETRLEQAHSRITALELEVSKMSGRVNQMFAKQMGASGGNYD